MGFDALGAGVHAEGLGKGDDGRMKAPLRLVRRGAAHEALVDLDLVERRLFK